MRPLGPPICTPARPRRPQGPPPCTPARPMRPQGPPPCGPARRMGPPPCTPAPLRASQAQAETATQPAADRSTAMDVVT